MNELVKSIHPILNDWFEPDTLYEGLGEAEFLEPHGLVKGKTKVVFNQHGEQAITLEVSERQSEIKSIFDFLKMGGLNNNPCIRLTVHTKNGIFETTGKVFYSYSISLRKNNSGTRLSFFTSESKFESNKAKLPKYWVLPLSNFVSEFTEQFMEFGNHPLRIYRTPKIPRAITGSDRDLAVYVANQKNRLIVFRNSDGIGFIEPLVDYQDRKQALLAGKVRNTLTAIMVGELGLHPSGNFSDLHTWFPIDYLHLLGIATGSEIGATWIEIRDERGKLVRRIHVDFGNPTFIKGHRSIDEVAAKGIGHLLTQAVSSPYWGTSLLRVVLRHVVRGGLQNQTLLEDRFSYLCRGFETLCKKLGIYTQQLNLTQGLNDEEKNAVKTILQESSKRLLDYSQNHETAKFPDKVRKIQKIGDRVLSSQSKSNDFGLAVCDLLQQFTFPDADIVDAYYAASPRPDKIMAWHQVLSFYRGAVLHVGYFDVSIQHNREDIMRIILHLHDALLRVVFRMLNYSSTYIPTVVSYTINKPIDWVKPDTPAQQLGYK